MHCGLITMLNRMTQKTTTWISTWCMVIVSLTWWWLNWYCLLVLMINHVVARITKSALCHSAALIEQRNNSTIGRYYIISPIVAAAWLYIIMAIWNGNGNKVIFPLHITLPWYLLTVSVFNVWGFVVDINLYGYVFFWSWIRLLFLC